MTTIVRVQEAGGDAGFLKGRRSIPTCPPADSSLTSKPAGWRPARVGLESQLLQAILLTGAHACQNASRVGTNRRADHYSPLSDRAAPDSPRSLFRSASRRLENGAACHERFPARERAGASFTKSGAMTSAPHLRSRTPPFFLCPSSGPKATSRCAPRRPVTNHGFVPPERRRRPLSAAPRRETRRPYINANAAHLVCV